MVQIVESSLQGGRPAKYPQRYEPHEIERALELYLVEGPSEASRQTGIGASTISKWAKAKGLETHVLETLEKRTQASAAKWAERRAALAESIGDLAEHAMLVADTCLDAFDTRAARDAASTMATAIDKAQLLTGGVTERVGVDERFQERESEIEQARLRAQAAVAAPDTLPAEIEVTSRASVPGEGDSFT